MTVKNARRAIALFLVLVTVSALIALRLAPAGGVKRHLQAIRAANLPTSGDELNIWYKNVPEKDNRALLLSEAANELVTKPGDFEAKWTNDTSPQYIAALTNYLETNKAVLAKLHRLPDLSGSRFPVDFSAGFATLLPHLATLKSLVTLLKLDTAAAVRERNADVACRSIESAFAAANAIRAEPVFISQLVGVACESIALNSLTNAVSSMQFNDTQLARLSTIVAQSDLGCLDGLFRGMVGERALGLGAFASNYQQFQGLSGGSPLSPSDWPKVLAYQAYIASGLRQHDMNCYLDMMELLIGATRVPFPDALARNDQAVLELQRRFSTGLGRLAIFSRMLLPSLERGLNKQAAISARLRCAEIALAVERYRLAHNGDLPAKLDDLVPTYLHKLPVNPFNGEALTFRPLPEKGYEIASGGGPVDTKSTNRTERAAFAVLR